MKHVPHRTRPYPAVHVSPLWLSDSMTQSPKKCIICQTPPGLKHCVRWISKIFRYSLLIFNIPHSETARSQSPDSAIELLSKGHETPEVARSIWFLHCSNCKIPNDPKPKWNPPPLAEWDLLLSWGCPIEPLPYQSGKFLGRVIQQLP